MKRSLLAQPQYKVQNNNVYLTLRNRVSSHEKTISTALMSAIEEGWKEYNETKKAILLYLFRNGSATITELATHIGINQNSIRNYLNEFIQQNIMEKHSQKQRDPNAKYTFKKD